MSKAELARQLGCTRSMIGYLCQAGMPARHDGTVNRIEALHWIVRRGGHQHPRAVESRPPTALAQRASKILDILGRSA